MQPRRPCVSVQQTLLLQSLLPKKNEAVLWRTALFLGSELCNTILRQNEAITLVASFCTNLLLQSLLPKKNAAALWCMSHMDTMN